jgi:predicted small secreted protein
VYNDFEQEVSVNGSFIYDDKKYNIETEEEMIYVDVV